MLLRVLGSRAYAAVASIVLVGATLSPVLRSDPTDDGFPLSTYPMFATVRTTTLTMSYAQGMTGSGEPRALWPSLLGSSEVLQAYAIVGRAVAEGAGSQQALCRAIAERVREFGDPDIVAVRIVTGTHDALDVLLDDKRGRERENTRCRVTRS